MEKKKSTMNKEELDQQRKHVYTAQKQLAEFKYLKENLKIGHIIIHERLCGKFYTKTARGNYGSSLELNPSNIIYLYCIL